MGRKNGGHGLIVALVACFGLSCLCWEAARLREQWGAGVGFVECGSDGHGTVGLGEWEGLGQLQDIVEQRSVETGALSRAGTVCMTGSPGQMLSC